MTSVKAVREAMRVIANAQTLLRETRDERAHREADLLDDRLHALARLLDDAKGSAS